MKGPSTQTHSERAGAASSAGQGKAIATGLPLNHSAWEGERWKSGKVLSELKGFWLSLSFPSSIAVEEKQGKEFSQNLSNLSASNKKLQ